MASLEPPQMQEEHSRTGSNVDTSKLEYNDEAKLESQGAGDAHGENVKYFMNSLC